MKLKKNYYFLLLSQLLFVIGLLSYMVYFKHNAININRCTGIITEENIKENIIAKFERVLTIVDNKGFVREFGNIYENEKKWRLNIFYTFSLKHISGDNYELKLLSRDKADDNDAPDVVLQRLTPESGGGNHMVHIENIGYYSWLFSGIAFPVYACKEPSRL